MGTELTARERYHAITHFKPGVRTLLWECGYWVEVVERWYREGLRRTPFSIPPYQQRGVGVYGDANIHPAMPPKVRYRDADIHNVMGFDAGCVQVPVYWRLYPLFPEVTLEEDDHTRLVRNADGVTMRSRKDAGSLPRPEGWPVKDRASWEAIKAERLRLDQVEQRFPAGWNEVIATYRERDFPFGQVMDGFFAMPRELLGIYQQSVMYHDDPQLLMDIAAHLTELWLAMLEIIVSKIDLDMVSFFEDMAFKNGPFISPAMFDRFCAPFYRRITGFLRAHGVDAIWVDTDGNCWSLIEKFLSAGVNGLWPMEAQAGMDVAQVRKRFPDLLMVGGMNKMEIAKGRAAIDAELEAKLPYLLSSGGYIPTFDHLVHPDVSWNDFCYYRQRVKEYVFKYQQGR